MSSVSCAARPKTAGSGSACDSGITVKLPTSVPREMRISSDEAQARTLPTELDIQTQGKRLPDRIVLTATIRQDEYVSAWPRPVKVDWSVEAWGANRKTGSMQL